MRNPLFFAIPVLAGLVSCAGPSKASEEGDAAGRPTLSLDGTWSFATDPGDRGEAEQWFLPGKSLPRMPLEGYAPQADGRIRVPGCWDNQGYGTETEKVRHNFVGRGWYRRAVEIPADWKGRRIFLRVTGVHRAATAWVNGRRLGDHVGYLSEFEFDVTDHVRPGQEATVTLRVDSRQRPETDPLYGVADMADYMEIEWGGIWGHVLLEARREAWIENLFLQPRVSPPRCRAGATVRGRADRVTEARLDIFGPDGRPVAWTSQDVRDPARLELDADIPDGRLWTPDTPHLYRARLSILGKGKVLDVVESRFGLRQIEVRGPHLLLNGRRLFLRGYGDDHVYVHEMALPADKALYLERLRTARAYGFNHVRHHSTIMPPEYYDACDELGLLATAEFPIAYQKFYDRAAKHPAAMEAYKREWSAAITRHRNHPSILAWVMGNELWRGVPLSAEFAATARRIDPTRPFADSDGLFQKILQPGGDRDTLDLYFLMFDVARIPLDRPDKFRIDPPLKPVISHETGNYVTFPRLDQFQAFSGNIKPFWATAGIERMGSLGLAGEASLWARNSERLYLLCHKLNTEALRKSPHLSGHHWWLLQDYWTTSNGLVDFTFRPKKISPAEVLRFVNDVVLLEEGLGLTYRAGDSLKTELLVSNMSPQPIAGSVLSWRLILGDRILGSGVLHPKTGPGEVDSAGRLEAKLPGEIAGPARVRLEADLDTGRARYANDWSVWVFPAAAEPPGPDVPVFAGDDVMSLFPAGTLGKIPPDDPLPRRAVYVAGSPDRRLSAAAREGAALVLLAPAGPWPAIPGKFKTSWWKGGWKGEGDNDCGTVAYDHPLIRDFAPDGWCDAGWYRLLEGCRKYRLEGPAGGGDVILRGIPHLHLMGNFAILFEARLGKGYVLVSGLNHKAARESPEGPWMLRRMIGRAAGFPRPRGELPATFPD